MKKYVLSYFFFNCNLFCFDLKKKNKKKKHLIATHFITALPSQKRIIHSRIFNNQSADTFCSHFTGLADSPPHFLNINEQISWFNNLCTSAFEFSAPYTSRAVPVINKTPWINNNIRQQRREYRKAERNWKKHRLEVHRLYMRELMISLNQTIKDARPAYLSDLIVSNKHKPRFLFTTINQLVTLSPPAIHASSPADYEIFLTFFFGKINNIRSYFTLTVLPPATFSHPVLPSDFAPLSLYKSFQKLSIICVPPPVPVTSFLQHF